MRSTRLIAMLLVATLHAGCASSRSSHDAIVDDLRARSVAWDRAIVTKDRVAIAANMDDDFRQIAGNGEVVTKAAFIDDVMDADVTIDPYTVEGLDVRLYGDTALLSGVLHMTGHDAGKPFASAYRYIDIYVQKPEGWRIVSVQITRLPGC